MQYSYVAEVVKIPVRLFKEIIFDLNQRLILLKSHITETGYISVHLCTGYGKKPTLLGPSAELPSTLDGTNSYCTPKLREISTDFVSTPVIKFVLPIPYPLCYWPTEIVTRVPL
jgi:hypothetical protein